MHILFLSDNFPPESNAPATRLYEHAVRWVAAGHDVTVITCAPNFPEGRVFPGYRNSWRRVEMVDGIRVVRVKTYITANEGFMRRTLDYLSFMVMACLIGAFERRPDIVVATSPQFFCATGGWLLSLLKRRPFVFELRDLWPASIVAVGAMRKSLFVRLLEKIELFLYRRADVIVSVTRSFRSDLVKRGIDADKIHVVVNGVDLERYAPRPRDESASEEFQVNGKFVVGYVGTHGMAHALPKVLEAAELLLSHDDIVFLFAGSGAERDRVARIVDEKGLRNVRLIPRQPKERMPHIWSLCDLTLVPLRDTPVFSTVIPSKMFEAMGMGVPIVMSLPEGEATGILRESGAGICVPPESPALLAEALLSLAASPMTVQSMRSAAAAAARRYSRDRLAEEMLRILEATSQLTRRC